MASKDEEQLGTLPPGTLALVLFDQYPYWPSIVLSRAEASDQPALHDQLQAAERDKRRVCAVRFFAVNTCAIVSITAVEPLIAKRWVSVWKSGVGCEMLKRLPRRPVS
jgi:hypothetical protein